MLLPKRSKLPKEEFFPLCFERTKTDVDVSTFQGETESCFLILDEVQGDLWISFLLEIGDDRLSDEFGGAHHVEHFIVFAIDQGQFEFEFRGIDGEDLRTSLSIQTEDGVAFDLGDVDRQVQGANDSMIPVDQGVFNVIRRGVDEDTRIIPSPRFHRDILLNDAQLFQFTITDDQLMFGQERKIIHVVGPDGVLGLSHSNTGQRSFLLGVVQTDVIVLANQKKTGASVEDLVTIVQLNLLRDLVLVVLDQNLKHNSLVRVSILSFTDHVVLVQNSKPISRHPNGVQARRTTTFRS